MSWIIIRMPDGTYAKIPADASQPPPPPPPPDGDWVTRPEFQEEVAARQAGDASLQAQIDDLVQNGVVPEELDQFEQRVSDLEAATPILSDLKGRVEDLEAATPILDARLDLVEQQIDQISGDTSVLDRIQVLEGKKLLVPVREVSPGILSSTSYQLHYSGGQIEPGPVTVLTANGAEPAFAGDKAVTGTVDASGRITLNRVPGQQVALIFGVELSFEELPREAFKEHFVTELERDVRLVQDVDRVVRDLELEKITPSGLIAASVGDTVYLSWSYTDTPDLSHFVVERLDPATGRWVPYDGGSGVVMK